MPKPSLLCQILPIADGLSKYMHSQTHTHKHMNTPTHMRKHIHIYKSLHIHTNTQILLHINMNNYIRIHIHTYLNAYINTLKDTLTFTNTYPERCINTYADRNTSQADTYMSYMHTHMCIYTETQLPMDAHTQIRKPQIHIYAHVYLRKNMHSQKYIFQHNIHTQTQVYSIAHK